MGVRQVKRSRRLAKDLLGVLVPAAFVLGAIGACFDQSTYQGGGRRDIGGKLAPVDAGDEEEDSGDGTEEPVDSGGPVEPVARDAGDAG